MISRFLNGPVMNGFLVVAVGLIVYVLAVGSPHASMRLSSSSFPRSSPPSSRGTAARAAPRAATYTVNWHARYVSEHAHVQRLLRKLRRVRTVQAHVEARPAHYEAWLCIHSHEGAWDANTGNGFWGGLQMDLEFQRDYGASLLASEGTADHWSPLEQMQVAERAWADRGFTPWPNTARICGVL